MGDTLTWHRANRPAVAKVGSCMRISAALAGLILLASGCASTAPAAPVATVAPTERAEVVATRAAVQAYVEKNQFAGTVLVAKNGKPVFRESFGLANRELTAELALDLACARAAAGESSASDSDSKIAAEEAGAIWFATRRGLCCDGEHRARVVAERAQSGSSSSAAHINWSRRSDQASF